jgi:hypothetical protein
VINNETQWKKPFDSEVGIRPAILLTFLNRLLRRAIPTLPHDRNRSDGPGGGIGTILLILLILILLERV